jgi:hypothetical protein
LRESGGVAVPDVFREKVRAAAAAGWWTFLLGAAFFVVQWFVYLLVMSSKPALALSVWGPGTTWDSMRTDWFHALAFVKFSLWLLALVALWLTLWSRQLRARGSDS